MEDAGVEDGGVLRCPGPKVRVVTGTESSIGTVVGKEETGVKE